MLLVVKMDEVHWPNIELELGTRDKKAIDVGRPDQGGQGGINQHLLDPKVMGSIDGSQPKPYFMLTLPF